MGEFMKSKTRKIVGSAFGAVALVSGGAGMAVAAPAAYDAPSAAVTADAADGCAVAVAQKATVAEGSFSYTQDAITGNACLRGIFTKAAATLCNAMPAYCLEATMSLAVSAPGVSMDASVADMAGQDDADSYTMACACSTNTAGGGAIANANVSGVALASVLAQMLA